MAEDLKSIVQKICDIFTEQYENWKKRNFFERKFIINDFRKFTGMTCDKMQETLQSAVTAADSGDTGSDFYTRYSFDKLHDYFEHQKDLIRDHVKDKQEQAEYIRKIDSLCELIVKVK